mmetsp:Transcript_14962/g.29386  ORF Transcript_14962/g.29386 Transcript_14962/m.29386 type:complete len:200 (+) Transcript_14962:1059-1658(+)
MVDICPSLMGISPSTSNPDSCPKFRFKNWAKPSPHIFCRGVSFLSVSVGIIMKEDLYWRESCIASTFPRRLLHKLARALDGVPWTTLDRGVARGDVFGDTRRVICCLVLSFNLMVMDPLLLELSLLSLSAAACSTALAFLSASNVLRASTSCSQSSLTRFSISVIFPLKDFSSSSNLPTLRLASSHDSCWLASCSLRYF